MEKQNTVSDDPSKEDMWKHSIKGGIYEVTDVIKGSGALNGNEIVVYRSCLDRSKSYGRLLSEWYDKMEKVFE